MPVKQTPNGMGDTDVFERVASLEDVFGHLKKGLCSKKLPLQNAGKNLQMYLFMALKNCDTSKFEAYTMTV